MTTANDMLGAMVRSLPGVVYRCALDEHWTMQLISDEVEEITGYPAATFIGNAVRSYASIIHDGDRARVEREIAEALRHGRTFVVEYRLVRADGRHVWVLERGRLVQPAPGEQALDGLIFDVTDRRRAQDELRASLAEHAAAQAVAEERIRLARELHDSVGHALSVIALQAGAAAAHLPAGADRVEQAVSAIQAVAADTLEDMDRLLLLLHSDAEPSSQPRGLADVPALVDRVRAAGVAVTLELDGGAELAADVDAVAYRVVQEGLTNAVKHAPGAAVDVTVGRGKDALAVEVRNAAMSSPDGDQRAVNGSSEIGGRGLAGLLSRVTALGGSLEAAPQAAGGFALRAVLPRATDRTGWPVAATTCAAAAPADAGIRRRRPGRAGRRR